MKKHKLYALMALLILQCGLLTACSSSQATSGNQEKVVQRIAENKPDRVVSLAPAVTEIICAVGAEDMLVGRTDYCDYPESVTSIPSVGSFTSPNIELIVEKSPDLVIASDSISDDIKNQLENIGIDVYVTDTGSVKNIKTEILNIGTMLDKETEAESVVAEMNAKSAILETRLQSLSNKKTVFCDLGDFYTCSDGAFLSDVMEDIGLDNIALGAGRQWIQLSAELVVQGDPDVYLDFNTPEDTLKSNLTLQSLDCMQNDGLVVLDYELSSILQREGPRIVDGELKLMEIIYGEE